MNEFRPVAYGKFRLYRFPELASTNDEASSPQYSAGDVIICDSQIRGRGQRGNGWHSQPGENLTLSIVAGPGFLPASKQFLLSEAVSLAVADTLGVYGLAPAIKWPNDIYIGDRKIAGILIENDICGMNLSRSVIGIGLNVNQTVFPDSVPNPVSMRQLTGRSYSLIEVLNCLLDNWSKWYSRLEAGHTGQITADYGSLIYRKGTLSPFRRPSGERFEGIITGVLSGGQLVIETETGPEEFLFKEVEFIIPPQE
ncbi:MAG: biotin--[acetyl-CoA-carboxylase] ligase [Alistipes sp.]|nr:biotin--[acetyl-CoA-carboxylase] ligase [Alistipes sp.]